MGSELCYGDIVMIMYDKSSNSVEENSIHSRRAPPESIEEIKFGLVSTLG